MGKGQQLYKNAKKYIAGGVQLLSKRPEIFLPEQWPSYYKKAKGCYVWDLDGKKYIDVGYMGVGSCILGYADIDINNAVKSAINNGSMCTLNSPYEVDLARLLCKIHPWADMVRYARAGGEAMAIAVRIARAFTGKGKILFCGYHGWHDWYLSANISNKKYLDGHLLPGLKPRGVNRSLKGSSIPFKYNDTDGFLNLVNKHSGSIAAVIMEPIRNYYPKRGFLETIRSVTKKQKIPLIFDEISSAWRLNVGGAHLLFNINPDIAVFSKALSNGYPMAAIIGRNKIMDIAQETFISSTFWSESIGPVAAISTIKKLREKRVPLHLSRIGEKVQEEWEKSAIKSGLDITITGIPPLGHFSFNEKPLVLKTLYTQEMLNKGFLATNAFYVSFAHKDNILDKYFKASEEVFDFISKALNTGCPEKFLKGPVCHSGFKRLT